MAPIVLIEARAEWHRRVMLRALAERGFEAFALDIAGIAFSTEAPHGLVVPGLSPDTLPGAVVVRSFPAGSFEATTRRLAVLHALVRLGVPVVNTPAAIEVCVDKSATTFRLQAAGLPTPATAVVETRAEAAAVLERLGAPLVLKPLFGAQGHGILLIEEPDDLPPEDAVAGVYYLQRFVRSEGAETGRFRDYRLLVSRGRVVAAMARVSAAWITNVRQGGQPEAVFADAEMRRLAVHAAEAVGADLAGVDLIRDADGALFVLEVNSMPAWSGLQSVTPTDIAAVLAADLAERLAPATERKTA